MKHAALLALPLALAAALRCAPPDAPDPAQAALLVRATLRYTDDVGGFLYTLAEVECATGAPLLEGNRYKAVIRDPLLLPSGEPAAPGAGPALAEHTFLVAAGCYDITAQPLRGATDEPSELCLPAHARAVAVADGLTTEVTLISQCPGQARDLGAVDLATNSPPAIALAGPSAGDLDACTAVEICAEASDADGDALALDWELLAGAPAVPPTVLAAARLGGGAVRQCAVARFGDEGELRVAVTAYDLARGPGGLRRLDELAVAGSRARQELTVSRSAPCTVTGRSLTILVTMHGPPGKTMPSEDAARLAVNAARWVGKSDAPRVLVVRDQNHRGADLEDVDLLVTDLRAALGDAAVDRVDEESLLTPGDLQLADVAGYDVVWFVNPGEPIDSPTTLTTLHRFRAGGGGLILQGDDIAQFQASPALADGVTLSTFHNGGRRACGAPIEAWGDNAYRVRWVESAHPVLAGLSGEFDYAKDLDLVDASGAALAVASFAAAGCSLAAPAVLAVDPAELAPP